jgi:hypothetical protein
VLEERGLELLLVNARHVKILPGRKTPSMSSCGGVGCLLDEPLGSSMLDRIVGHLVEPAAPDHPDLDDRFQGLRDVRRVPMIGVATQRRPRGRPRGR